MITVNDIRHADGRMQIDITALGYSDPPEWKNLRREMNAAAKKHFNNKPFQEIADTPAPQLAIAIFRKMCDIAEKRFPEYSAPLSLDDKQ